MPRADTATRIQRTPVLKYMGASLVGEREPVETQHHCSCLGTFPSSPEKGYGKAAPGRPLSSALGPVPCSYLEGAHAPPQRAWGSSSLALCLCLWPQRGTRTHVIAWQGRVTQGHQSSQRDS